MEIVNPRCAGLDLHKRTVVACVLVSEAGEPVAKTVRTFGTMPAELLALGDWLAGQGVTHVAMESTGVYWKPVWNLLEDRFTLLLVNAQHIKAVPGRKTDVRDSEWLASLLRHGLLQASFVPDRPQRELRELVRYRTALVRERAATVNRLAKTLEGANIKLSSVASDLTGVAAQRILTALVAGTSAASELAAQAQGRLRAPRDELAAALEGRVGAHQRFLVGELQRHLEEQDAAIARLSAEIAERQHPFAAARTRLQTIPRIGPRIAEVLLAEVGPDLTRFRSAAHLASWAGMCPGQQQSAGKRGSGRTRKGSPWLRTALVEAAQAAGRTRDTYLSAQYRRLAARRGARRAAMAVGHTILVIAYHLLTREQDYTDLGGDYFLTRDRRAAERRLQAQAKALGYELVRDPAA